MSAKQPGVKGVRGGDRQRPGLSFQDLARTCQALGVRPLFTKPYRL
jgi:hypothetical protein